MKIAVGCDHGGIVLKEAVLRAINDTNNTALDLGTYDTNSVDYPTYAYKVTKAMQQGLADRGILMCGTGIGISIAANKFSDFRCAHVTDAFSAQMCVEHNDAMIMALGGRITTPDDAYEFVKIFLTAKFDYANRRHGNRLRSIYWLEAQQKELQNKAKCECCDQNPIEKGISDCDQAWPQSPQRLTPILKDYVWGGNKLMLEWGKSVPGIEKVAESWELSTLDGDETKIEEGTFAGLYVTDLINKFYPVCGTSKKRYTRLRTLIKILDANADLSIQVHPDDAYAERYEKGVLGKTETWYIADAKPDAAIYLGFNKDVSEEELRIAIKSKQLPQLLNKIEVKVGDCFFVPAGTVHALLSGVVVVEVQESSYLTYRLYDYGRTDTQGKERDLHIEKALQVLNKSKHTNGCQPREYVEHVGHKKRLLAATEYFIAYEVVVSTVYEIITEDNIIAITVVAGSGKIGTLNAKKGDSFLIPAYSKVFFNGDATLIETKI
ncbi:MAG: RpiB/LacA/LacB family sugar-phosphate isomerase [Christensenellaceae bacterium]|jgi:mannose-6-phosphate isomerase|nr:RpiB/LacA/LacB family sugar-phosphate isomerase [Christensenellaceae bacterium]